MEYECKENDCLIVMGKDKSKILIYVKGEPVRTEIGVKDLNKALNLFGVSGSMRFSEREIDFAYLCGAFNTSGIDGLHNEIQKLKELGKEPHDIIEACRKQ